MKETRSGTPQAQNNTSGSSNHSRRYSTLHLAGSVIGLEHLAGGISDGDLTGIKMII